MNTKKWIIFMVILTVSVTLGVAVTTITDLGTSTPYVNTGQGNNELYAMNQDVESSDAVTYLTVDTGQGANELYAMNQDVESNDAVTYLTVDTGQGANELYAMNQDVLTSSNPTFTGIIIDGMMNLGSPSTNDILIGNITITKSYELIDTEGDSATDELYCIYGGSAGDIIYIQTLDSGRDVTYKHNSCSISANRIRINGLADVTADNKNDLLQCIYRAGNGWICDFQNSG